MKRIVQILVLTAGMFLCLTGLASSSEKSVIVGFHQKPGPSEEAFIHGAKGIIKRSFHLIPAMAVSLPEEEIAALKRNSKVAYIEEDVIFSAVEPLPGDEYANSWGVWHIFTDIAHASGNRGAGVRVAIIDTGIDYTHPDLAGNFKGGYDFVFNDDDPFDDSSKSHGTHVAGVIAAEENGTGVIGVAPEADIYAVKVLDGGGFGDLSWIISGIEWAVDNQMEIINMSLEGPNIGALQLACDAAYDAGVLLVAAGGNLGLTVRFPAAYESVVAVTATDMSDNKAFTPSGPEAELAAPGVDILSTVAVEKGSYDVLSGTSQAAPHVAGTAALLYASIEDLNSDGMINNVDVRQALQVTAIDLGELGKDDDFGYGLVNASEASLPADVSFTITSTSPPANVSETVHLAGISYEVTIVNNGLSKINVDVFEDGDLVKDLSSTYHLRNKNPQEVTFILDATGKRYDVTFTPRGKAGTSANIIISAQGEEK
jgi:subtilisin